MTTLASLRILLGLDAGGVSGAARAVQGDLRGVQAEARNTNARLNEIGKGVVAGFGLGGGLATFTAVDRAVSGVISTLTDAVQASIQEEAGIRRLNQTLAANVQGWDGNTAAIDRAIQSREALAFSDDALRDSLGALSGATGDVQKALDLQSLAMDVARFKGIGLAEATDEIIRVQAGALRSLKSYGIELAAGTSSTEALAAIQKVVAGQAQEFGKTTAGAAEAAGVAIHDLEEDIGSGLAPVVRDFANFVRTEAIPVVRDLGGAVHEIIGPLIEAREELARWGISIPDLLPFIGDQDKLIEKTKELIRENANHAQSNQDEAIATQQLTAAQADLQVQFANGVITQDEYAKRSAALDAQFQALIVSTDGFTTSAGESQRAAFLAAEQLDRLAGTSTSAASASKDVSTGLDEAARSALALTVAIGTSADATKEQKAAAQDAMAQFKLLGTVFDGFNGVVVVGSAHMDAYSADLDNTALRAAALKTNVDTLGGSLNALPTNIDIDINVTQRLNAAQFAPKTGPSADIAVAGKGLPGFEDQGRDEELFVAQQKQHIADVAAARTKAEQDAAKAAREAEQAREKAAREAAAAERKYASEMHDSLNEAYRSVGEAAKRYFSDVHTARLKDIDEARKAADDLIEQQKRANLQPVTEAEAALRAIQQQRELGQLQSQLAAAQTPEDKLRAQQALNDFEARARIDTLRANADAANTKLDQDKAAQDDAFAQQKAAEDQRYQDQLRAFEADEKALKKHLDNATGHWQAYFREIAALAKRYGVSDLVGVYPNPATSTGRKAEAAASVTAATPDYPARRPNDISNVRMDTTAERPIVVYIYLDGEDITSKVDIRQGTRQSIVTSGGIAR